jgi:hypothetical protein
MGHAQIKSGQGRLLGTLSVSSGKNRLIPRAGRQGVLLLLWLSGQREMPLGFIKETENVGFMEAVEILAAEAGMSVPKPDPKMVEKADRRKELGRCHG